MKGKNDTSIKKEDGTFEGPDYLGKTEAMLFDELWKGIKDEDWPKTTQITALMAKLSLI